MAMPNNIILVRHGESEGNVLQTAIKQGQDVKVTADFMKRHTCDWRLTTRGIWQAKKAGKYLRENIPLIYDRYYVSHYLRAIETAGHLGLPEAKWYKHHYLVEKNWGIMDRIPPDQRSQLMALDIESKELNAFYWKPPRGESILDLCLRVDRVLNTLYRECEGQNVIIVCHGEVMWAFRVVIERITLHDYLELDNSKNPFDRIHNCQIIHYSRQNPESADIAKSLGWVRSICPWDLSLSSNDWQKIIRPVFSNQQLIKFAEKTSQLIDNE